MEKYRPLSDSLEIKESNIEGVGLFAKEDIEEGYSLGVSHLVFNHGEVQRTPLGGFYNHSDTPNCIKVFKERDKHYDTIYLKTIIPIKKGDELTVKYTFYSV
tara:strand:+ start:1046 stop:1351 length:306 start_codon:yes stop_codon:yes gene_type:complete